MNWLQSTDLQILDFIQEYIKNPVLDILMPLVTSLGNSGAIWILSVIVFLSLKKYRKDGIAMAFALLLGLIFCNIILKNIIARPRPFSINPAAELMISPPSDYSFPSGHSCASFASAAVLMKTSVKKIKIPALILAVLIAFSRLYLYVHFPTDVIAGILTGFICGISAVKISDSIKLTKNLKYSKEIK